MRVVAPKRLQVSGLKTKIIGLRPGAKYNVTVSAASDSGLGSGNSATAWTRVGTPVAPAAPQLVQHHDDDHGEIHVRFSPVSDNPSGPITAYRVVVINESRPAAFDQSMLAAWSEGAAYWVAADVDPNWFRHHDEFVVGDGRR